MAFQPKSELVNGRALKVQRLSIPFSITASATAANVVLGNDEPGFCFLKSQGNDQITAALDTNETATYTNSPNDASGVLNILVKIAEPIGKVIDSNVFDRVNGGSQPCFLGSATGITTGTGGGKSIMLTMDSTVNHTTTNFTGCLVVEYSIDESA